MSSLMEADYSFIKHLFCEKSIINEVYNVRNLFKVDRQIDQPIYNLRRLFREQGKRPRKVQDERFYLEKLFEIWDEKVYRTFDLRFLFEEDIQTPDVTRELKSLCEPRKPSSEFGDALNILSTSQQRRSISLHMPYDFPIDTSSECESLDSEDSSDRSIGEIVVGA
uniref:Uncharacterized protein n=1 Tax=Clytia hemisphaerica TaxID=252671 RepID=A0A7M5X6I6_9CNID